MKRNIKTNLKLAGVCATSMMTLSGCENKYTNIVEAVSSDKLLVRDVTDGKQRILELGRYARLRVDDGFKYFHIGDTIDVVENMVCCGYQNDKCILVYDKPCDNQYKLVFNKDSMVQRKNSEIRRKLEEVKQQQQAKFDSLKCAIARENQEKQR